MLGVSLYYNKPAQAFNTQQRTVTWQALVTKISSYHRTCQTTFNHCKMKSDEYGKVKQWIFKDGPEQAHEDALQRTGVAEKYRNCGQWLLDDPKFTSWSSPKPTSDCQILWLRGTS